MNKQKKAIERDMEFLIKLLHREWERSGRTKAVVTVKLSDVAEINNRLSKTVQEKQKQLENEGITFKQSMELSKQNFVLLRLIRKVKKMEEKSDKGEFASEFTVELDREEYKLFADIVGIQEG